MPRQSERQELLDSIVDCLAIAILEEADDEDLQLVIGDHPDDGVLSLVEHSQELLINIESSRYLRPRAAVGLKAIDFKLQGFPRLSCSDFRLLTRTDRDSFAFIVKEIEGHSAFKNQSGYAQAPVWQQLAVVLDRLGSYGNGASMTRISLLWGVSKGTVNVYTNRVLTALSSLSPMYVSWPTLAEREAMSRRMHKKGFSGCVGFIDGTTIPLAQKPALDGEFFFDRKKRYSINAQVVCDDRRRIIAFCSGWPGSCGDSTVYKEMKIAKNESKRLFFEPGQYLIADSAYPADHSHHTILPAYKSNTLGTDIAAFNTCLAHVRVVNEHTIGVLKNRWSCLKELRTQINDRNDIRGALKWMEACVVLHNMLVHRDVWDDEDSSSDEDNAGNESLQFTQESDEDTYALRRELKPRAIATARLPGGILWHHE